MNNELRNRSNNNSNLNSNNVRQRQRTSNQPTINLSNQNNTPLVTSPSQDKHFVQYAKLLFTWPWKLVIGMLIAPVWKRVWNKKSKEDQSKDKPEDKLAKLSEEQKAKVRLFYLEVCVLITFSE